MNAQKASLGIRGRVKIEVADVATGRVVLSRPWQKNLLLDQGMNNLATVHFAELFEYACAGTGTAATKETVATSNSYSLASTTLTRTAGTRDFTVDDVGKLVRQADAPFTEAIITAINAPASVEVRAVGQTSLANFTNKDIILYSVQAVGLVAEVGDRTNEYSTITGENGTTTASNVRTLKRTFIFAPVEENSEDTGLTDPAAMYSQSGTTVTQTAGTRDFTAADIGSYIYWPTDDALVKITALTDPTPGATIVSVDTSGTHGPEAVHLYGGVDYGEIGFSHIGTAGNNINVRVRIEDGAGNSDPVRVDGPNPEASFGQQLRVTYELEITCTPNTVQSGTALITDPGNIMSGNKNGTYVIEHLALSAVDTDGGTNLDYTLLEPATAGAAGFSPVSTALVALNGPDRSGGSTSVDLEPDSYVPDSFTLSYEATFSINDAIATNWRTLGIYDVASETFPFAFLFAANQTKSAAFSITVRFQKTWNRDLS